MDELEISGKLYISSKKAARQNKYHVDYIGQLIRGGKIVGTKVGRAWYVEAASLASYLNEDPEQFALKKNSPQAESGLENREFSEKKSAPEAPVLKMAPRVGLTYLSETDFFEDRTKTREAEAAPKLVSRDQDTEVGGGVHGNKKTAPDASNFSNPGDFGTSLPHRRPFRLPALPFLGRVSFGLVTLGVFAALFVASYKFSYTASLIDGQEASAVTFGQ